MVDTADVLLYNKWIETFREGEKKMKKPDVYEVCPVYEDEKYRLRLVEPGDLQDLLKVYSDPMAVPFFNGDNCNGDTFYYPTEARMGQALDFWRTAWQEKWFVRWAIVDQQLGAAVGTIELFHRDAEDFFTNCGLLRLDLRSDYEREGEIQRILALILTFAFEDFHCQKIATKAVPEAVERIKALEKSGFSATGEKLAGHDGTKYDHYFYIQR